MPSQLETHGRGTGLAPECVQEALESASNAGAVGQSAFFTPLPFGKLCARPLAQDRTIIVDLTAGNGALAIAASTADTLAILLSDIENVRTLRAPAAQGDDRGSKMEDGIQHPSSKRYSPSSYYYPKNHRIAGDLGGLFPLMKEVDFRADCIVLNPPFSLKWKKEAFAKLAESDLETVRRAFTEWPDATIDSTVMTLMAALDLCSRRGEGFLIGNDDTLERLIFADNAPFRLLETHVWARAILTGNEMTGERMQTWDKTKEFHTGIIWFAASHDMGLVRGATHHCDHLTRSERLGSTSMGGTGDPPVPVGDSPAASSILAASKGVSTSFEEAVETLSLARSRLRTGSEVWGQGSRAAAQDELWRAVRAEWDIRQGKKIAEFNIWLTPGGAIETYLSIFDSRNTQKIPKAEAKSLFALNGQKPMQLVMQRESRTLLLHHANGGLWRVDPRLKQAVEQAMADYYAIRAPLMPLNEIQSLGYIDEQDMLECKSDLEFGADLPADIQKLFDRFCQRPCSKTWDAIAHRSVRGETFWVKGADADPEWYETCEDLGCGVGIGNRPIRSKPTTDNGDWESWPDPQKLQAAMPRRSVAFHAGKSYKVRTQTVSVSRTVDKPGMDGELHQHYFKGQELAIYITDETGAERCFMDKRLRELAAKVEGDKEQDAGYGKYTVTAEINPDFDLETLVNSFTIPTAPDVATTQPERYRAMLGMLDTIEGMVNAAENNTCII